MQSVRAVRVGIVLRRFSPVEHAVVPHHANMAKSGTLGQRCGLLERLRVRLAIKGLQQDDVTGRQDRVGDITGDES
jgi:hypothetical protein